MDRPESISRPRLPAPEPGPATAVVRLRANDARHPDLDPNRACPVFLIMRHGQRAELRCLKYLRRLGASVVSLIMGQIDAPSVLSHQV
jgi:hypothetical protein